MRHFVLAATLATSFLWTTVASGVVLSGRQVVLDFTQLDKISPVAKWNDPEFLTVTPDGLGWDGDKNSSKDITIELLQPIPVGWSWHPLTSIHIEAEALPAGEFQFGENSIVYPSTMGTLYVRYSPDGRNWSTWQALSVREPRDRVRPKLQFQGSLRVPEIARKNYLELLEEFERTDRAIPGSVNQEAAAGWILEQDPKFFEQNLPFIGYVDFLWETQIRGDQRLKQLQLNLQYLRGGFVRTPAGHNEGDHWRFKAPTE